MALVATGDSCVAVGVGVVTTWVLSGSTTAYAGTLTTTDGYKIVSTIKWVNPGNSVTSGATTGTDESFSNTNPVAMGTCVETLGSDNATALATTVTTDGNHALCHFVYWLFNTGTVTIYKLASATNYEWGRTLYMTTAQWGTNGAAVVGSGMYSSGGSLLTSAAHGLVLAPVASTTSTLTAGDISFTWYQPTFASTYASTTLRRYNGGGTNVESVQAYCVSQRLLATTTHKTGGWQKKTAVTALTGASALAATAIAFGAAALAI